MPIHLRQICLVARDLRPVEADLAAVLSLKPAFHDDAVAKWGLENVLMPVGHQFLEVVAPTRAGTAAGRYLDRRGGDGGYMVITQVPTRAEQEAARERADAAGVRVAYADDRGDWTLMQLHPRDLEAAFLEIDWDAESDPEGRWMPAGGTGWTDAVDTSRVSAIAEVQLQGQDPSALAGKWAAVAGSPVVMDGRDPTVALANSRLRFLEGADGRGPGLAGLVLTATDADAVRRAAREKELLGTDGAITLCGTRIELQD